MLIVTVSVFLSQNNKRLGVQQTMYDAHSKLINVKKFYLTPFMMMVYGYYVSIGGTNVRLNAFNQTYDEFLQFLTQSRTSYINYFNAEDIETIETISFGNICKRGRSMLIEEINGKTVDLYQNCVRDNDASATRGIFGYIQFEQNILQRTRNVVIDFYQAWLNASTRAMPARAQTGLLFYYTLVQQRIGHRLVLDLYYKILEQLTVKNIGKITAQLEFAINEVLQAVSVILFLLMMAGYLFTLRLQNKEILRCYESYKLIDPYFLMNNRYLQHKFKSAFQGHE